MSDPTKTTLGDPLREAASAGTDRAREEGRALLDEARQRAEGVAEEGRRAGADQAQGIARAVHRAAEELHQDNPAVARLLQDAAGSIDGLARALRDQSPGEMMRGAEDWARRQPYVFLGVAALAGFAAARFARSSAGPSRRPEGVMPVPPTGGARTTGATTAPGWTTDETGTARPMTRAAATLGGAAARGPTS